MYPNSAARISPGQMASDTRSAKASWAAANESPTIPNLLAVATHATGLIVDVEALTSDKNRLLHAARAAVLAVHAGDPNPMAELVTLLAELGVPVHELTPVSP